MTTAAGIDWPAPDALLAGLSVWSAGHPSDEAAVELLAEVAGEAPVLWERAPSGWEPWIVPSNRPGVWMLDGEALAEATFELPRHLCTVVRVAASLSTYRGIQLDLGRSLSEIPLPWLGPVLAGLGHAAGCRDARLEYVEDREPVLIGRVESSRYHEVQGSYLVPTVLAVPVEPVVPGVSGVASGGVGRG